MPSSFWACRSSSSTRPSLRDVLDHRDAVARGAVRAANRRDGEGDVHQLAVLVHKPLLLPIHRGVAGEDPTRQLDSGPVTGRVIGHNDLAKRHLHQLRLCVAEHLAQHAVGLQHAEADAHKRYAAPALLKDGPEPLVGGFQCLVGPTPHGQLLLVRWRRRHTCSAPSISQLLQEITRVREPIPDVRFTNSTWGHN